MKRSAGFAKVCLVPGPSRIYWLIDFASPVWWSVNHQSETFNNVPPPSTPPVPLWMDMYVSLQKKEIHKSDGPRAVCDPLAWKLSLLRC